MSEPDSLRERFVSLSPHLDERARRLWGAAESKVLGPGGARVVSAATGIAVSTIYRGLKRLASGETLDDGRLRRPGGGREALVETDSGLIADLLALVEPDARGDPMSPLRWTCESLRRLAAELAERGHRVSHTVMAELLKRENFSLQANSKTREGSRHPDRDAQFGVIDAAVKAALAEGQPVVSVDTKKEFVGDFKNHGRERRPQGEPEEIRVHGFPIEELGRAVPYGIYDLAADAGWVGVGMDHDTSAFAVDTIRRWWIEVGRLRYAGPSGWSSPPTAAAPTGHASVRGRSNFRLWPPNSASTSDSIACRPAPADGTRSSTSSPHSSA